MPHEGQDHSAADAGVNAGIDIAVAISLKRNLEIPQSLLTRANLRCASLLMGSVDLRKTRE